MYQAILFSPDGEHVTDFQDKNTVQDVWEEIADMGSRWIFYPIAFVGTNKTISDTPEGLEYMKGKRIETVKKILQNADQSVLCDHLNNGWPLSTAIQEKVIS